ncbi:MAG TPA: winged helix-turn-helix domain-containing protein [Candidatus Limnocylindria bacterium]|nr:winged helix-turn-helix domain-containing protein [Candidatus Limnocylindria bacterium]
MQAELRAGLPAGRWRTAGQVAAWLQEAHGIKRAAQSLYRWLGKAGGALRVPRPCHVKQDPAATAAFRARLEQRLEALGLPKERPFKVWVADAARFGLHTQSRRCWALRGQRVVIPSSSATNGNMSTERWKSSKAGPSSASCPKSAGTSSGSSPTATRPPSRWSSRTSRASTRGKPSPRLPAHIHLLAPPPYSPELNPTEGLWDQLQDVTCNRRHDTLNALEESLTTALRPFWETPARVLSLIHHWLHDQASATP